MRAKLPGSELTEQREKFAKGLAAGMTQADAFRAAYKNKMTPKQVYEEASKLAANPNVRQRVKELTQKIENKFVLDTEKLLREASKVAFSDVSNLMTEDGRVKLPHELDPETRGAIASFKIDEFGRVEYKFWDKNNSHERLFKHRGLFEQDNKQRNELGDLLAALGGRILGPVADVPGEAAEEEED